VVLTYKASTIGASCINIAIFRLCLKTDDHLAVRDNQSYFAVSNNAG